MIRVYDLGLMEYGRALELQKLLVSRRPTERYDSLLLLEHEHVITLGRRTTAQNLKEQPIPVFRVDRGGDATYHGPGQLIGYPIMLLRDHDVKGYLRRLEAVLIETLRHFGVVGERLEGHTGVWVRGRKVASIGVAVAGWVTYHGFALNVNTDMSYFSLIRPCGLEPEVLTSMKKLLGVEQDMAHVKDEVAEEFGRVFGQEVTHERAAAHATRGGVVIS
jgi:lipoate-protein ligase B